MLPMKYIQRAYILSNSPKISTTRKNNNFLLLWNGNAQNVPKSPISGHLTYFRTPNPKDDPLYYHGSTFRGSYFPESLHKFILPENIFISYFCAMKMHKMYPKVVYPVILTYFRTPSPTKCPLILLRKYI